MLYILISVKLVSRVVLLIISLLTISMDQTIRIIHLGHVLRPIKLRLPTANIWHHLILNFLRLPDLSLDWLVSASVVQVVFILIRAPSFLRVRVMVSLLSLLNRILGDVCLALLFGPSFFLLTLVLSGYLLLVQVGFYFVNWICIGFHGVHPVHFAQFFCQIISDESMKYNKQTK